MSIRLEERHIMKGVVDALIFKVAQLYSLVHEVVHQLVGINIPGMGILLRLIRRERTLLVKGKSMYFNPDVADCYQRLINGRFNEPETHVFLAEFLQASSIDRVQFVEVGANIGEFIVDMASNSKITNIVAFEPQQACSLAIERTCSLNGMSNVSIINKAVSDSSGVVRFENRPKAQSGSGILANDGNGVDVISTTIDAENLDTSLPTILLIDAEGAELRVMIGGRKFIRQNQPLIVFEYNFVSQRHFTTHQVLAELGEPYALYRLRQDGKLDALLVKTWNLVAVSHKSLFGHLASELFAK